MTDPSQDDIALDVEDLADRDRSAVRLATLVTLTCAVSGAIAIPLVARFNLTHFSLFYEQFARIEPPALLLAGLFAAVTLVLLSRSEASDTPARRRDDEIRRPVAVLWPRALWIALAVLAITVIGTDLIFHRFVFADDEYSAYFQALIFARGKWSAFVSPEWCRWIPYMTPTSIARPQPCTWHLSYLPIHSMIRALFIDAHADRFAGPVMAAITVLVVGATARRLWPAKPHRMWIAMAVLATSTQFLIMSMTMYSMPTHLLFASVWLWLYVDDRRWSIILLPVVGVLAMGIHSPIPHALLIPIFWLRYVRQRRVGTALYVAAVYAAGAVFWYGQLAGLNASTATLGTQAAATAATAAGMFHLPSLLNMYTNAMNVALITSWNTPVAVICAFAAGIAWHRLDTFERDAALTLLFILVARAFSNSLQGEGWGYRFIYSGLGVFALLAAGGAELLASVFGARRAGALLVASLAASLVIQLPMRGVQVEGVIRPYYRAYDLLSHQRARIVVFPSADFMWARQLLRNDPFLAKAPVIMSMHLPGDQPLPTACVHADVSDAAPTLETIDAMQLAQACAKVRANIAAHEQPYADLMRLYPNDVHVVTRAELMAVGLPRQLVNAVRVDLDEPGGATTPR